MSFPVLSSTSMVASSGYRFYVEIHAEFSGWVAISKRENVGGMVIDREIVTLSPVFVGD